MIRKKQLRFTDAYPELRIPVRTIPPTRRPKVIFRPFGCLTAVLFLILATGMILVVQFPDFLPGNIMPLLERYGWAIPFGALFSIWLFGVSSLWSARQEMHKKYIPYPALCLAWDLFSAPAGRGRTLHLSVLCRYATDAGSIDITPKVGTSTFLTRAGALRFLNSRVNADGMCHVYVKPDDPTDGYLAPYDWRAMGFMGVFFLAAMLAALWFMSA